MKNTLIGTKTVRMERFHLVQKLYSFLDLPGVAALQLELLELFQSLKKGSKHPAARPEKFPTGFISDPGQRSSCGGGL